MRYPRIRTETREWGLPYAWVDTLCVIVLYQAIEPANGSPPLGACRAPPGRGCRRCQPRGRRARARRARRRRPSRFPWRGHGGWRVGRAAERDLPDGRTIELAVETSPDGTGHLEAFLQIQSDLSLGASGAARRRSINDLPRSRAGDAQAEARRSP